MDSDPKVKELQENKELQNLRERYKHFLEFQDLGQGGFGSVTLYYDIITRKKLAKKQLNSLEAYVQERDAYLRIYDRIPRQKVDTIIAPLVGMNYETKCLYFETGVCNLWEFFRERMNLRVFLFDRQRELAFLLSKAIEFVLLFHKNNLYHGDLKTSNYVLLKKGLYDEFYTIKLIDLGGLQFSRHWSKSQMGTPDYFPPESDPDLEKINYNPFRSRDQRVLAELYQVARWVQELMLTSIFFANKLEFQLKFGTLKLFMNQIFHNSRKAILHSLEVLQAFYDEKYIHLLRLIFELKDQNLEQIYTRARALGRESGDGLEDIHSIASDLERKKRHKFMEKISSQKADSLRKFEENIEFLIKFDQHELAMKKIQHRVDQENRISNKLYFHLMYCVLHQNFIL